MKKLNSILLLLSLLSGSLIFTSCQKNSILQNEDEKNSSLENQKNVSNWLNKHKLKESSMERSGGNPKNANIELLKQNLDFNAAIVDPARQ